VINPRAKKESIIIDWHGVSNKFGSVSELKKKLAESLSPHVAELSTDGMDGFKVGYFHGRPQMKSWIVSEEDLQSMYSLSNGKEILLWCDGKSQVVIGRKRKHGEDEHGEKENTATDKTCSAKSSAQAHEIELEENISKLQTIHEDKYDYGQYRLWARLIINHQWKDFNNPPNIPMITGRSTKKKAESVADTLATAAVAIIKALKDPAPAVDSSSRKVTPHNVMSPTKKVHLRSQY